MNTHRSAPHASRFVTLALGALLLARLILGLGYSALNPLGEAPDEADHYAYASYIGREGRLPEGAWMTQAKHPPLYHALAAAVAGWTGMDFSFLRSNPDGGVTPDAAAPNLFVHTAAEAWPWRGGALAMHLGRLVSVLAGLATVASTYGLGHALWPGRPWIALAAAAFVAFLPESLFIGGAMSNDMLAAMFATLALWAGLRARTIPAAVAAGLCMGLAGLSKVSTVSLWPIVCLAVLWPALDLRARNAGGRAAQRQALGRALLAGALALLMIAPWVWRNWRLYGDPLGMSLVRATVDQRTAPLALPDILWLARGWFFSFWGRFGGAGHIALPTPLYTLWGLLLLAALAGWVAWLVQARRRCGLLPETSAAGLLVLLGAPILTTLSIISYSRVALGTDQGRLLFPALAPLSLLLAGGLAAWLPPRRAGWLAGVMAVVMGTCAASALAFGIWQPFAPPAPPPAAELAQATPAGQVFGEGMELVALRWESDGAVVAPTAPLTLYWREHQAPRADLRVALRLVDAGGNLIWEWKHAPAAGRFSADRWLPGQAVRDAYRIPSEPLGRAARVEVGVYTFPEERWLPLSGPAGNGQWLTLPRPGS